MILRPKDALRRSPWCASLTAVLLTGLAFALRVYRLGHKAIWWDEGLSADFARMSLAVMADTTAYDVHPPLYFALLHSWRLLVGDSEFALRMLSVYASLLLVPLTFRVARQVTTPTAALIAALYISVAQLFVWYAQELRPYVFASALALAALAFLLNAWHAGRWRWRGWLGYVLTTTAGLFTLYIFVGVLLAQILASLIAWFRTRERRQLFGPWLAAQAVVAGLFLPWLSYFLPRVHHHFTEPNTSGVWGVVKLYLNALFVGNPSNIESYWPVMGLGLTLLVVGLGLAFRARRPARPTQVLGLSAMVASAMVPLMVVWLVNLPWSFRLTFNPEARYFSVQLPWAIILLGIALTTLIHQPRWGQLGLVLSAVLIGLNMMYTFQYLSGRYLSDDFKSAAATLAAYRQPEDALILHNDRDWPIVAYHFQRDWLGLNAGRPITSEAVATKLLEQVWNEHAGVWLLLTPEALVNDPQQNIFNWLAARALAQREYRYDPTARLYFFARTPGRVATADTVMPTAPAPPMLAISPAPGLTLTRAEWVLPEYRQGDTLRLFLYWHNQGALGVYPLEARLIPPNGELAEAVPALLELTEASPGMMRQQINVPIHAYLGPGRYSLSLSVQEAVAALGSVLVVSAPPILAPSTPPAQRLETHFENRLTLRGYTAQATATQLSLTLYWSVAVPQDMRFKLFAHAQGATLDPTTGSPFQAQIDRELAWGGAPLTRWRVDEVVADTLVFDLPPDTYTVSVGWYDFFTGQRLLVLDSTGEAISDQVTLGRFSIESTP